MRGRSRGWLYPNHPNPFNPVTVIAYDLPEPCEVILAIYTAIAQHVATLVSRPQEAGQHEVTWDGSGYANGIYFYRLEAGEFTDTKTMLLLK